MKRRDFAPGLSICASCRRPRGVQRAITLHGAVPFDDDHVFTRALVRFGELVKQRCTPRPVNFSCTGTRS